MKRRTELDFTRPSILSFVFSGVSCSKSGRKFSLYREEVVGGEEVGERRGERDDVGINVKDLVYDMYVTNMIVINNIFITIYKMIE